MEVAYKVANRRVEGALSFLKTTFNPIVYNAAPPCEVDARSDILKDVTVQGQFTLPSSTPIGEGIPFSSGMVLWLLKRGFASIYRMAFVPTGAVSNVSFAGANGLVSADLNITASSDNTTQPGQGTTAADGYGIISTITYVQELAIPVGSNNLDGTITVTPAIDFNIVRGRVYAGVLSSYSSSVSIGNTTLAGTFTASSLSDTRFVAQSPTGAFSITNLVQSSETTKDAVIQVPSDQGVNALVGPDVQDDLRCPLKNKLRS